VGKEDAVNERTLFAIGLASKAFTASAATAAAALARPHRGAV
jgi:CubicO group peptidase (beta-lactamase class C family)